MHSNPASPRRYDRERLLAVAVEVFAAQGFAATSMGDLADAAGLSKSSLYHHVRGKEEFLRLPLERAIDPLFAVLDEPDALKGRAIERLRYVIRREVETLVERLPWVTLLLRADGPTPTEQWALGRRRELDGRIAGLLSAAVEQGDLDGSVSPRVTARLIFGLINSLTEWTDRPASPERVAELADQVESLIFDGIRRR